ncbi:MAG TPA: NAD(P)H-binding protein [Flavipsychrobacter sp.]|nr:NAD(P)H-binding protein [Flavipsychrobacter sp.]
MKALIIGATGATGKDLVNVLLNDSDYKEVVIFVRRHTGMTHPKLSEVLTDFEHPEAIAASINGNVLFSCLGTTLKAAGSKDKQQHIDYEIPLQFATLARANGVSRVVLLSAYGASAISRVFYSRIKGELEEKMKGLSFEQFIIFRPGLLLRKETDRLGEKISAFILKILNHVGLMSKFRPLPTATLAEKLARAPKSYPAGEHIVELEKIFVI